MKIGYTEFQQAIINAIGYSPMSLTTFVRNRKGTIQLETAGPVRTGLYCLITLNTFVKGGYLLLLVLGYYGEIDFLDSMSAMLWLLMCAEICQELLFWSKTYPLFEVLASQWTLLDQIFQNLGSPMKSVKRSRVVHLHTVVLHTTILLVGCFCIGGQFLADPKYAVYTYSALKRDNPFLLAVFTLHEVCFMWQAWTGYLSIVTISSVNAVELSYILQGMQKAILGLEPQLPFKMETIRKEFEKPRKLEAFGVDVSDVAKSSSDGNSKSANYPHSSKNRKKSSSLDNSKYSYKVESLLHDYTNLMLVTDRLNDWCAYRIVGVHFTGYCQFIADVFMMIRLMRLTDMDVLTVLWYGEDAAACLYMIFRMFTLMSEVEPASDGFLRNFKWFLAFDTPMRKRWRRVQRTLRPVSLKLGPSPVKPATVGTAVGILMNYYLCVALWK